MITGINFGGLTVSTKAQPIVAPIPEEYKQQNNTHGYTNEDGDDFKIKSDTDNQLSYAIKLLNG